MRGLIAAAAALVAVALPACDGSVMFQGATSELVVGTVSDGPSPLADVEVFVSFRERGRIHFVGRQRSDESGRYDLRASVCRIVDVTMKRVAR